MRDHEEQAIGEALNRLGVEPERVFLRLSDTPNLESWKVTGEAWPHGHVRVTYHPDAKFELVLYGLLHELGHRGQYREGMTTAQYNLDVWKYEVDAWSRADAMLGTLGVVKTLEMADWATKCLETYAWRRLVT